MNACQEKTKKKKKQRTASLPAPLLRNASPRHAAGPQAGRTALRWIAKGADTPRDISYAELDALSSRFANVIAGFLSTRISKVSLPCR